MNAEGAVIKLAEGMERLKHRVYHPESYANRHLIKFAIREDTIATFPWGWIVACESEVNNERIRYMISRENGYIESIGTSGDKLCILRFLSTVERQVNS